MKTLLSFLFITLILSNPLKATDYNIVDFGAVSDTSVLSTEAIQSAIDKCSNMHGGRVIIPPGKFTTGTLLLKDNVNLHVSKGATLYGSKNILDYDRIKPNYIALRTREETRQLIFAENIQNVSISGAGTIDGQGSAFPSISGDEGVTRPHLIQIIRGRNVVIEDVSLQNSGAWMQHYLACDGLQINGIKVFNHSNKNNDGIDLDGCKNVTVANVIIDADDDGICLKSTSAEGCENISITNCVISSHCNGLKMGTESNTGFKNISISNVVIKPSRIQDRKIYGDVKGISGISLEIVDGGVMDGVVINNIRIDGTQSPIFVRLGNRARPFSDDQVIEHIGQLQNISISNVLATNAANFGCSITGLPGHPVKHVSMSNITLEFAGNGTLEDVKQSIPEHEKKYPEATMFGKLPAYGFFIRHASDLHLSNIILRTKEMDARPGLYLDDVAYSEFHQVNLQSSKDNVANVFINDGENILLSDFNITGVSNRFLEVQGVANHIVLKDNVLINVDETYKKGPKSADAIYESGTIK